MSESSMESQPLPEALPRRNDELVEELEQYRFELETQNDELRSAQRRLEASQHRYYELFDMAPIGYLVLDGAGKIVNVNLAGSRMLSVERRTLVGRPLSLYLERGDLIEFRTSLDQVLSRRSQMSLEMRLRPSQGGTPFDAVLELKAIDQPESGAICLVAVLDVSVQKQAKQEAQRLAGDLQEANQHLAELAQRDPLTRLFNRRGLEEHLRRELDIARRSGSALSAVLIDCDKFKQINDRLGHTTGDVVLAEVALRIQRTLRASDIVARIGGDEFMALLPDTNAAAGSMIAERIRLAVAGEPVLFDGEHRSITVSLGITGLDPDTATLEEVLALTQRSLSAAKRAGRNRVFAGHAWRQGDELDWRDDGAVYTVSQRIVRLADGSPQGFELLSRPGTGFEEYSVIELFRRAADMGDLIALDLHCLRGALDCASHAPAGSRIHINVLPSTLLATSANEIARILDEKWDPRSELSVEISEQQLIGDPARLLSALEPMRDRGVQIVMDDVGFGNSSLESLLVLEPNTVKIDRSVVHRAAKHSGAMRTFERLAKVLQSLNVPCVAEGIETDAEARAAGDLGIEFGQGYLWGRPGVPDWTS